MQMTWPGAPTIYYGDEAGVCGWTDPDSRRTYPWGRGKPVGESNVHRYMSGIRKRCPAFTKWFPESAGGGRWLYCLWTFSECSESWRRVLRRDGGQYR